MREPLFIKKNKDKWESYDANPTQDPNILSERFVHILDDLAYAQTFYPKGKTVKFLNERAVTFYNEIYKKKKEPFSKLFDFWRIDLPLMIRRNHRFLFIALILFLLFVLMGTLSAIYDSDFFSSIVGKRYIRETKENIRDGNPFGIYGDSSPFAMFLRIGLNNIALSFVWDFVGGLFFCLGTLHSLLLNGMMVGGFHYLFYEAGLGWQFFLVVFMHGTFELFAIVLAAAAGFRLFNSIVFIGTYKRIESIKKGAQDGMQLMILVFLLLIVAAFLESYITRLAASSVASGSVEDFMPIWVSVLLLIGFFTFIIWYFGIYPVKVARKYRNEFLKITAEQRIGKVKYSTANA
jgi:uncharacterized membrane protein SpoIIM required for sporulation